MRILEQCGGLEDTRRMVVAAGKRLAGLGLSPGTSGNISIRAGNLVVMSPTGRSLAELEPDSLSVLSIEGELCSGPAPSKEFPLHRAMYRRHRYMNAVVHLHSAHAAAVSCLPPWSVHSAVPPLTPYFVMRVGQTPLIPYASPGSQQQADEIESLEFPFSAVLLQNHGSVCAAPSMDLAIEAAAELEEVCRLLTLVGSRDPLLLPQGEPEWLAHRYGTHWTPCSEGGR